MTTTETATPTNGAARTQQQFARGEINTDAPYLNRGLGTVYMRVTPAHARAWLNLNTENRPLRQAAVDAFAHAIRDGKWETTHQGVAFSTERVLIDGQHRLRAIEQANTSVEMAVSWGLPPAAFDVVDTHGVRTGADLLSRRAPAMKNRVLLVAVVSTALRGLARERAHDKRYVVDACEALAYLASPLITALISSPDVRRAAVIAAFVAAARTNDNFDGPKGRRDFGLVLDLANNLGSMTFTGDGDPMKLLLRRLRRAGADRRTAYGLTVSAIRAALDGTERVRIEPTTVDFGDPADRIHPGTGAGRTVRRGGA